MAHLPLYTAAEVDGTVATLEDNAAKMRACDGKMVRLRAQEANTLKGAEMATRLFERAMKGDKQYLADIFGANGCERIGRVRVIVDSVEFKDNISKEDPRWQEMATAVKTIEIILKDLGRFKPYVPGATPPPESLKYKGARRRVSPRRAMNLKATLDGGACTFSVEGVLPAGLVLDPETGTLSGAVLEDQDVAFTVVAKNDAGKVREDVVFQIAEPPPVGLTYPDLCGMLTVGERHAFSAVLEGGCGRSWKIQPALPEGFELNESSGAIVGAATTVLEPREYTVTATNAGGSTNVTFSFGAQEPPPEDDDEISSVHSDAVEELDFKLKTDIKDKAQKMTPLPLSLAGDDGVKGDEGAERKRLRRGATWTVDLRVPEEKLNIIEPEKPEKPQQMKGLIRKADLGGEWHDRCFLLDAGRMLYFNTLEEAKSKSGVPRAENDLLGAAVEFVDTKEEDQFEVVLRGSKRKAYRFKADIRLSTKVKGHSQGGHTRDRWVRAFEEHISYAKSLAAYQSLVDARRT